MGKLFFTLSIIALLWHCSMANAQESSASKGLFQDQDEKLSSRLIERFIISDSSHQPQDYRESRISSSSLHIDPFLFNHHKPDRPLRRESRKNYPNTAINFDVNSPNMLSGDLTEAWVRYYASRLVPSNDEPFAIGRDPNDGSIYVTGASDSSFTGKDYLTLKYSMDGNLLWSARYDGLGNGWDYATAIAIDSLGNICVTGKSEGLGTDYDYATVKYNASGIEQWVAIYNGPGNEVDESIGIAVDIVGNVYVTGSSHGSGSSTDYATIKYDASGIEQWVARYNGVTNSSDYAIDIEVDDIGNVYVTGNSSGSGTNSDYVTIKYNSSGIEQWTARYNGTGNYDDNVSAITIDNDGNVYVTGGSRGSGTFYDYATIKYDSSGIEQWASRYDGPSSSYDWANAITVDDSNNVYVTGESYGPTSDYATIKYNYSGEEQWVARYNGTGGSSDAACKVVVGAEGSVYVTGYSMGLENTVDFATIKYNSTGIEQWVVRYNGPLNDNDVPSGIVVDSAGDIYIAGWSLGSGTSSDYATIKYSASGEELWVARYNGPGNSNDMANAIAVDRKGNVYVTGHSQALGSEYDYLTIKYNSLGEEQWNVRYNGTGNSVDWAFAITIDSADNVYVTGGSTGSGTSTDYATIKYDTSGVEQWVARYNGAANSSDYAIDIAVDRIGNVYVTGRSSGSVTRYDYVTIKYNSSGIEQWAMRYDGPGNQDDYANAMALDSSGNVFVTGESSYDYATIKYDSSGTEQWTSRYDGFGYSDRATAVEVDVAGNVYVTGTSVGSGTGSDYLTIKYNSSGVEQWTNRYNGSENKTDDASSIAVSRIGNVYITGRSYSSETSYDYATIKYNFSGEEQWIVRYNGPGNSDDEANELVIDGLENVYITGFSFGSGTSWDYATIKYNSSGVKQWTAIYNGMGNSGDYAEAIALDGIGNVYVTGHSYIGGSPVYATIKYVQPTYVIQSINMMDGWNIISVPLTVSDSRKSTLFPLSASSAFAYEGGYVLRDTLKHGVGYWLKFNGNQNVEITGNTKSTDTLDVHQGWNMIGSLSYPALVNNITTLPDGIVNSSFFRYVQNYEVCDSILPGIGYWVKVGQNGKLILNSSSFSQKLIAGKLYFDNMNNITLRDSKGNKQNLYFDGVLNTDFITYFELPPPPPEGSFDVRFSSGRMLEILDKSQMEYPIHISSVVYPLNITWEIKQPIPFVFLNINGKDTPLLQSGSLLIDDQIFNLCIRVDSISGEERPKNFVVNQNYPNPFNPITTIHYELPKESQVSLTLYNLLGQTVSILVDEKQETGRYDFKLDATTLPSGIYFYRLQANNYTQTKKLVIIK